MGKSKELIEEAKEKHRHIKNMFLSLMEQANTPNYPKQRILDEMFTIYLELK